MLLPLILLFHEGIFFIQVAETLGDKVKVLKIDVDENPELSSQLKVRHETTTLVLQILLACGE